MRGTYYSNGHIFCLRGFVVIIFAGVMSFSTVFAAGPKNIEMLGGAWEAFNQKKYDESVNRCRELLEEFEPSARRQEKELTENSTKPLGTGRLPDGDKDAAFRLGLINDVGACFWIIGRSSEYMKRKQDAVDAYQEAVRYIHARVWDKSSETFWSPSEIAKDRLARLTSP